MAVAMVSEAHAMADVAEYVDLNLEASRTPGGLMDNLELPRLAGSVHGRALHSPKMAKGAGDRRAVRPLTDKQRLVLKEATLVACWQLIALGAFPRRRQDARPMIDQAVHQLFIYLSELMEAGRKGQGRFEIAEREFYVNWSAPRRPVVTDMSVYPPLTPDVFGTDRRAVLAGLKAAILEQKAAHGEFAQMEAVYAALQPYEDCKELPLGLSEFLFRFFSVSAAFGAWEALQRFDSRRVDLLLRYYTSTDDVVLSNLAKKMKLSEDRISRLLLSGLKHLWQYLPDQLTDEFPLDKRVVFPLNDLQLAARGKRARRMREREGAMRGVSEQSWRTWPTAEAEEATEIDEEVAVEAEVVG